MKSNFWQRHKTFTDILGIFFFIISVTIGTILINSFTFQSFTIVGGSMENTFHDGDKVIINRLPITWANLKNSNYTPKRGEIIVFKNPQYQPGMKDQYIIKRVIAFPGEKVKVNNNGDVTVFNSGRKNGFNPDSNFKNEPKKYTSHPGEWIVPENEIFVMGDNREGNNSYDSRSGLGTVPLYDIVGPVAFRIFPIDKIRTFEYPQN